MSSTDAHYKHIIMDLTRTFEAFTSKMNVAGAAELYYANVDTSLTMTKNASYVSATLLADLLLVRHSLP